MPPCSHFSIPLLLSYYAFSGLHIPGPESPDNQNSAVQGLYQSLCRRLLRREHHTVSLRVLETLTRPYLEFMQLDATLLTPELPALRAVLTALLVKIQGTTLQSRVPGPRLPKLGLQSQFTHTHTYIYTHTNVCVYIYIDIHVYGTHLYR